MNRPTTADLTTTKAPFIENAKEMGQLFLEQPYELYSEDNQRTWKALCRKMKPKWERFGSAVFKEGMEKLALSNEKIPKLSEVNKILAPLTGFKLRAVSGLVPVVPFFECLSKREFPTTITIRDSKKLDYLPEPDIFHDLAGHVPMHTDPIFAEVLVKYGTLAKAAIQRQEHNKDQAKRYEILTSNIRALSRFFWFTVEFGLMNDHGTTTVYGSGLLSSSDEIEHCVLSPQVIRLPFDLQKAVNQPYAIDDFQPLLFIVDSFEHLYEEVKHLEQCLLEGRLDKVAKGYPFIEEEEFRVNA